MTDNARKAAEKYANATIYPNKNGLRPADEYSLQQLRLSAQDDFLAGWQAASKQEPTDAQVEAALGAYWTFPHDTPADFDENDTAAMRAALKAAWAAHSAEEKA